MNEIPQSVVSGRRVAMTLLVIAMLLTVAAVMLLIAWSATRPVVV
jgi:hypothetical protein